MDLRPLRPKQVDVTKLRYSPVKTLDNGSKTVYVNYGSDKLTIQTPMLHLPYGIDTGSYDPAKDGKKGGKPSEDVPTGPKRYDVTVSFRGMDENPEVKEFFTKIQEIEKRVIDDAFANRLAWLRDDYDGIKGVVGKLMSPIIKFDKDRETGKVLGRYPPTMKFKLPYDNVRDDFNLDVCDMDRNPMSLKECLGKLKGARGRFLIQLTGIWIAGGKFGCSWKCLSMKLQLASKSRYSFLDDDESESGGQKNAHAFSDDEDLEEEAVLAAAAARASAPAKKAAAPALIQDSDEEDEEEEPAEEEPAEEDEEEEDLPPPPPAPVATKGKKAAAAPPPPPPEEEDEDEDEEEEDFEEPPPPPPKKAPAAARKPAAKK